ncbi:MAG TPA: hypothetical protein PLO33_13045 [Kouleothrix sp.]|uniref:hypothetical protein n=1 Tax=Kouleothrix sp. TaxID=2779161 RepID=UPI002BADB99D|nr:hypothetical protein [Kouleothrix sp.]HRC76595.1 hypothetical protein [Kouleothrix sp.]
MYEDDDKKQQIEHSEGDHVGCIVVAIYAGAAGAGLVTLATMSILLGWWQGLIVIAVIVGVSLVLWALIRFGAH